MAEEQSMGSLVVEYTADVANFDSADFPLIFTVMTSGNVPLTTVIDSNGLDQPLNGGSDKPLVANVSVQMVNVNLTAEAVKTQTVVVPPTGSAPPFQPGASRQIRILVRNFPITAEP